MRVSIKPWRVFLGSLFLFQGLAYASEMPASIVPIPWIIESADYAGDVKEQIVRLEARYTIQITHDGPAEVPISIPGAAITAVKIEKKSGEAHIAPRNGSYVLVASKKGTYKLLVRFSQLLSQDSQFEGLSLGIPQATFSTMTLTVPRKDVELRPADQLYVERQLDPKRGGVKLTAKLGASERMDLRWRTKPAAPVKVEPVVYGEVHTLVNVEEQLSRLTTLIQYRIAQGEIKELSIAFPAALNVLNVRGAGIEDWHVAEKSADTKVLLVALNSPLKDTSYRLTVESEQTIEGKQARYALPEMRLEGVKQERGYIAVSRSGSIEIAPEQAEGINRVDVKELPDDLRAVMASSASLAFKYHQHPFQAALSLTRHDDHPVLNAIAERASLATVVSQQGELLTRAVYSIRANKKQFLEAALPEGAQLWSCLVNGKSVKPVKGKQERLLIPMEASGESAETTAVEMVYFQQQPALARLGHLKLQGPTLDVPTTIANWSVYTPESVKVLRVSGNLERKAAAIEFLEDESTPAVVALLGVSEAAGGESSFRRLVKKTRSAASGVAQLSSAVVDHLDFRGDKDQGHYSEEQSPIDRRFKGGGDWRENKNMEDEYNLAINTNGRFQEAGILPLKIRLPKSGAAYRFSRLMTTEEPLQMDATFVRLPMPWALWALFGVIVVPVGAFSAVRSSRR